MKQIFRTEIFQLRLQPQHQDVLSADAVVKFARIKKMPYRLANIKKSMHVTNLQSVNARQVDSADGPRHRNLTFA